LYHVAVFIQPSGWVLTSRKFAYPKTNLDLLLYLYLLHHTVSALHTRESAKVSLRLYYAPSMQYPMGDLSIAGQGGLDHPEERL
jgi:hypothetical protein